MKRTNTVRVVPTKNQEQLLEVLADRSAALWNTVQHRCRQAFFKKEPLPSYAKLCAEFKDHPAYKALPAHVGQEIIKKARTAWNSFFACLRLFRSGKLAKAPRIPGYWKDRKTGKREAKVIPVKAATSYSLDSKHLSLTLPADMRNGQRLVLQTKGVLRFTGAPKTLELKRDPVRKRWYARQVVDVPEPARLPKPEKHAALDLGARTLVALAIQGLSQQILFSGREVWKDFLYWTKQIAKEQARLAQDGRKTSRKLRRLYQMRAGRLKHALTALAAEIARVLKRHGVTVLHIEDLTGIRDNMDFGPKNLLAHNFWAFGMIRNLIVQACGRIGIKVRADAPKDSLVCAMCEGALRRRPRHKVFCKKCGAVWHSDANAAAYSLGSSKERGAEAAPGKPPAPRWNKHRWTSRAESPACRDRKAA